MCYEHWFGSGFRNDLAKTSNQAKNRMPNPTNLLVFIAESLRPLLEVGILSVIFYYTLKYIRGTRGANILTGFVIALMLLNLLADSLNLEVFSLLFAKLWTVIPIIVIVIFHPELRRAFAQIGTNPFISRTQRKQEALNEFVQAVNGMARRKTGALIIFERQIGMRAIINNAVRIEGRLSRSLLESIFYPNSPLHDGAVIVKDDQILAAHAILPLSQDESLFKTLGTRHRAAIGITEETDAVAVVVSEETGAVSIAYKGKILRNVDSEKLSRFLGELLVSGERAGTTFEESDELPEHTNRI
jgi:diadenylate cyclase